MGFFSRRRQRESAVPPSSDEAQPLGSFASGENQPVVGQQVSGAEFGGFTGAPGMAEGLAALSQLGPMIEQAMKTGSPQVSVGEPQEIDASSSALGDEIKEIMRRHGIDPDGGQSASINAADYEGMQQEMLAALARHGIDPGASGSSLDFGGGQK
jgi:hypothetical protein